MMIVGATPIVLLPGMDGTGELLTVLADRLSKARPVQVIAYPREQPLSYAELIAYVLARVPDRRYAILGESFSGPIAINIAAGDKRVTGLILAASFARHPLPSFLAAFVGAMDLNRLPKSLITAALMGANATPGLKANLSRILASLPRHVVRARARAALNVDARDHLREISCPVMCLHGRNDRLVRKRSVDEIVAAQPRCQVRTLDAPHMLLSTHAEAAADAINDFCDGLGS